MPPTARLDNKPAYAKECIESLNKALGLKDVEIWCRRSLSSNEMEKLSSANVSYICYEEGAYFLIKSSSSCLDIARFTLCQLRGCCGICMTTGEYVSAGYRGRGVATILGKFRKAIAKDQGYTVLLCTDVTTNLPQKKVLKKHGWLDVFRFRNKRTGNEVDISVVPLDQSYEVSLLTGEKVPCITAQNSNWKSEISNLLTSWFF